jgi:hypothetical protein
MQDYTNLWLGALYLTTFGVCFGAMFWVDRREFSGDFLPPPSPRAAAEATALEALSAMRGIVHQIGNNTHELAMLFDLAITTADVQEQQQLRDQLRATLHRFIEITHHVAELDTRLTGHAGYVPIKPPR